MNPDLDPTRWPEAMATVTACTYDTRAGRALAFGLPSSRHFRITYNYWAADALHTGEYFSAKAVPQGSLFPLRYNPDEPHTSHHAESQPATRGPLLALGVAGSIVISLAWLLFLHGCQ